MSARWVTLVVWALVAASALFWGFRLFAHAPAAPPQTQLAAPAPMARGDLSRLLGADAAPAALAAAPEPSANSRFQLIGVVSPRTARAAREGLALIAVDGKPPRAYRVGAVVDGQTVLQSVGARGATLGPRDGAALVALNIAPPQPAATGQLLPAGVPVPIAAPPRPSFTPQPLAAPFAPPQGVRRVPPSGAPDANPSPTGNPDNAMTR